MTLVASLYKQAVTPIVTHDAHGIQQEPQGKQHIPQHWRSALYSTPSSSPGQRLPPLVWEIRLLHGAQTLLFENAAIAGDPPGTLGSLGA